MKIQVLTRSTPEGTKRDTGIKILHMPANGKHNFKREMLDRIKAFTTEAEDKIILHTVDGDVTFKVDYRPGRHCLTCGEKLPEASIDQMGEKALAHIAEHSNAVKTDRWPHGFLVCAPKVIMTTVEVL